MSVTDTVNPGWRAAPTAAPAARAGARYWSVEWLFTFLAFSALLLTLATGGKSIYAFLGVIGLYGLAFWRETARALVPAWPLAVIPALAVLSVLWSDAQSVTLRYGVQFALTALAAAMMARRTSGAGLIGAIFTAFLLVNLLSIPFGKYAQVGVSGEFAFAGLFGSKNEMGGVAGLLLISAGAVLLDRRQPIFMRGAAIGGLLVSIALLAVTRSAGSLGATAVAALVLLTLAFVTRLGPRSRGLATLAVVLTAVPLVIAAEPIAREAEAAVYERLGKDPTLTGRTYLWDRAADYIADKPVLGHGYYAFWRQGNLEAEGLWRYAGIESRAGFNFHNQYVEALVDLGWAGLIAYVALIGAVALGLAWRLVTSPTPTTVFAAAVFVWLMSRTPVESLTLAPFHFYALLFFVACALGLARERKLGEVG